MNTEVIEAGGHFRVFIRKFETDPSRGKDWT